jgi:hypothetical protein
MEVLQWREVSGRKVIEVFSSGDEGPFDIGSGQAGRVLVMDPGIGHFGFLPAMPSR